MKASYCVAVHRAVDVGGLFLLRLALVVARLHPGRPHVDAVGIDDGGDGVEEGERLGPGCGADGLGQRAQVSGPVAMIQWPAEGRSVTSSYDVEISGCAFRRAVTAAAKGSRSTARAPPAGRRCAVGHLHDQPARGAHLPVEKADGVLFVVVRAEGVGADHLGEVAGAVGEGADLGAHLVDDDGDAAFAAACQAASDPAMPPPMM